VTGFKDYTTAQYLTWEADGPNFPFPGTFTVANTTVFTIDRPTSVVAGDLIVVGIGYDFGASEGFFSGNHLYPALEAGWNNVDTFRFDLRCYWKIATSSEPSTYSFQVRNAAGGSVVAAYANLICGVWEGFTSPVFLTQVLGNRRLQDWSEINETGPPGPAHVDDIPSATISGTDTVVNGGLAVYFWMAKEFPENFDGSPELSAPNPPFPASIPWVTTAISPTADQHAQVHFEHLPWYEDRAFTSPSIATYPINSILTLGSEILDPGPVPDGTATFTWQHAGDEAGFGEFVVVYRLILDATTLLAYWGILAVPL
jgi:hypothetical protein